MHEFYLRTKVKIKLKSFKLSNLLSFYQQLRIVLLQLAQFRKVEEKKEKENGINNDMVSI